MNRLLLLAVLCMSSCVIIRDPAPKSGSLPYDVIQEAYIGPLRGIRAVRVLVSGAKTLDLGFTGQSVEDEIIDRFERAGIPVEQVTSDYTVANVEFRVTRGHAAPYKVELTVMERALLLRDLRRDVFADTSRRFETAGSASEVRDTMLKLATQFIRDYKLANPETR